MMEDASIAGFRRRNAITSRGIGPIAVVLVLLVRQTFFRMIVSVRAAVFLVFRLILMNFFDEAFRIAAVRSCHAYSSFTVS